MVAVFCAARSAAGFGARLDMIEMRLCSMKRDQRCEKWNRVWWQQTGTRESYKVNGNLE